MVANLLNNAAKYTDEGGAIDAGADAAPGPRRCCSVRDNGIGIDAELLPHVFDLFAQGERSLDRSQGGLGVGLTLVQRLVELHGGTVDGASAGAGQRQRVPVVRCRCLSERRRTTPARARDAAGRRPRAACRVLVVDDNRDAAEARPTVLLELGGTRCDGRATAARRWRRRRCSRPRSCCSTSACR